MHLCTQRLGKTRRNTHYPALLRLSGRTALAAILFLFVAANAALAGHDHRADNGHESRIYGIVEKIPQDKLGPWIVSGREIVVTKSTRIREKHGKAEAGAYVEAEGVADGKTFIAGEIEVKRAK